MNVTKNILTIVIYLFLQSCGPSAEEIRHKELVDKCGCEGVDDCLGKYKYEAARKYAGEHSTSFEFKGDMEKIITAEGFYNVNNRDYERALLTVEEAVFGTGTANGCLKNKIRYEILDKVIEKLIDEGNFQEAQKWALKAPDDRNRNGWTKDDTQHFDNSETQQKLLLKKIEDTKKN